MARKLTVISIAVAMGSAAGVLFCSAANAGGSDLTLDPTSLPPAERAQALSAPLGAYGPFGQPADPGCYWSRFSTPTPQGVRWLLEENCSDLGTQAH